MLKNFFQTQLKRRKKINLYITLILFLSISKLVYCQNACYQSSEPPSISNTDYFNNILIFNDRIIKQEILQQIKMEIY